MRVLKQLTPRFGTAPRTMTALMMAAFIAGHGPNAAGAGSQDYEIRVLGSVEEAIAYWKERDFWGG